MQRILKYVKDNKKIIITVVLIVVLIFALYFINKNSEKPVAATYTQEKSATEAKLTAILKNIEGVGDVDVMINERNDKITGVIIVCEGANSIMTRNNILNAVSTALDIDKNIIAIYSMN